MPLQVVLALRWEQALGWLPSLWLFNKFALLVELGLVALVLEGGILHDLLTTPYSFGIAFLDDGDDL